MERETNRIINDFKLENIKEIIFMDSLKSCYLIFNSIYSSKRFYKILNGKIRINHHNYKLNFTPDDKEEIIEDKNIIYEDWICSLVRI